MIKKTLYLTVLLGFCGFSFVLINYNFVSPLNIPLRITGYYGDIRSNSFHFGIDYSTNRKTGIPIYSIADGYVARIKVEPGGYGKAIYINHPNGLTSVYAHLDSFYSDLNTVIRKIQYEKQMFVVDTFFKEKQYNVEKGSIIGYSGNSGQSSAPHLHFEIRETRTQHTINPFIVGIQVNDNIAPTVKSVFIYPQFHFISSLRLNAYELKITNNWIKKITKNKKPYTYEYSLNDSVIYVPSKFYVGIEAFDQLSDTDKHFAYYESKLFIDSTLVFHKKYDKITFNENKWVNGIIDFQRKNIESRNIYLQFLYSNLQPFSIIKKAFQNGLISLSDSIVHNISIEVIDKLENTTKIHFKVKRKSNIQNYQSEFLTMNKNSSPPYYYLQSNQQHQINFKSVKVVFDKDALFHHTLFEIRTNFSKEKDVLNIIQVGDKNIPIKNAFNIHFNIENIPIKDRSKVVVVRKNGSKNWTSIGGNIQALSIIGTSRVGGIFGLMIDTVAPTIKPLDFNKGENLKNKSSISLKITDNLSDIKKYDGYIDNQWVLFEYDKKSNTITYYFDEKCKVEGRNRKLYIKVIDNRNNSSELLITFIR